MNHQRNGRTVIPRELPARKAGRYVEDLISGWRSGRVGPITRRQMDSFKMLDGSNFWTDNDIRQIEELGEELYPIVPEVLEEASIFVWREKPWELGRRFRPGPAIGGHRKRSPWGGGMIDFSDRWEHDQCVSALREAQERLLKAVELVADMRGYDVPAVTSIRKAHGDLSSAISDQEVWAGPVEVSDE